MIVLIPNFDLMMTAGSGQCFRMWDHGDNTVRLFAFHRELYIKSLGDGLFEFSCSEEEFAQIWQTYFDLETDYQAIQDLFKSGGDYLQQALAFSSGLRILRQDAFEVLISFIISQRKSIPAIMDCVNRLSMRFGERIGQNAYAFPSAPALALASEQQLKSCGLGYRVPYVKETSAMVASGQIALDEIAQLDDHALHQSLLAFPGVGDKVAACTMLFGFHRLGAFPVDVWIQRALEREYPEGIPSEQFDGFQGVLQQHIFCYERHLSGRSIRPPCQIAPPSL